VLPVYPARSKVRSTSLTTLQNEPEFCFLIVAIFLRTAPCERSWCTCVKDAFDKVECLLHLRAGGVCRQVLAIRALVTGQATFTSEKRTACGSRLASERTPPFHFSLVHAHKWCWTPVRFQLVHKCTKFDRQSYYGYVLPCAMWVTVLMLIGQSQCNLTYRSAS
jgi:hypothetical protein